MVEPGLRFATATATAAGDFLPLDAVVDPSHRCSPLKESRGLTMGPVAKQRRAADERADKRDRQLARLILRTALP
jgi:hypothetical protein